MRHPTLKLGTLLTPDNEITHRELCWLVRSVIAWKNQRPRSRKETFHQSIRNAVRFAKSRGTLTGPEPTEDELHNIVARPPADLKNMLGAINAAFDRLIEDVPATHHQELLAAARERAERQNNPTDRHLPLWGRALGLDASPPQEWSDNAAGDYFILRRLLAEPRLLVSHMEIRAGARPRDPAEFVTTRAASIIGGEQGDRIVRGILYEPLSAEGTLFTIGKIAESSEIRSTILRLVPKPIRDANKHPMDLAGIRLGLGPGLSVPLRMPAAYRIWCARLPNDEPAEKWLKFAKDYPISKKPPFAYLVPGFSSIVDWLGGPASTIEPLPPTSYRGRQKESPSRPIRKKKRSRRTRGSS